MSSFHGATVWILNTNKVNSTKGSRTLCTHYTHARCLLSNAKNESHTSLLTAAAAADIHSCHFGRHLFPILFASVSSKRSLKIPCVTLPTKSVFFFLQFLFDSATRSSVYIFHIIIFLCFICKLLYERRTDSLAKCQPKRNEKNKKMQTSAIRSQVPQVIQHECWRRRIWEGKNQFCEDDT